MTKSVTKSFIRKGGWNSCDSLMTGFRGYKLNPLIVWHPTPPYSVVWNGMIQFVIVWYNSKARPGKLWYGTIFSDISHPSTSLQFQGEGREEPSTCNGVHFHTDIWQNAPIYIDPREHYSCTDWMSSLPCPVLTVLASVGPVLCSPGRLCWLSSSRRESRAKSANSYFLTTCFCLVTLANTSLNGSSKCL